MRILITNHTLAGRAGSELFVRDLAMGLVRRGHDPVAFSTVLGDVADELRRATIPVLDDLRDLKVVPDVIHGQHHLDAMAALLRFPDVPAVLVCHGWLPWEETPVRFPSILRYVAVDDLCRERLLAEGGIPPEKIQVIRNFVDLERFRRRPPLPARPRSALVFSNYAQAGGAFEEIRLACKAFGIERVDLVGKGSGRASSAPEQLLGEYDLVFAKGRCALEAMATGCAVVVADYEGLGGMVTTGRLERFRALNFGVRALQGARTSRTSVLEALEAYCAEDAARVTDWIRSHAGMDAAVDAWIALYEAVSGPEATILREGGADLEEARRVSASGYLCIQAKRLKGLPPVVEERRTVPELAATVARLEGALPDLLRLAEKRRNSPLRRLERFLRHLWKRRHPSGGTGGAD
jgi:hypothetical protein